MNILAFIATTIFLYYYAKTSSGLDKIIPNYSLNDNRRDTLVSSGETFELGFFSPGNSSNRYVGVWFKKTITEKTVVWVANRDKPIRDSSGILRITSNGSVVILRNQSTSLVWSSHSSTIPRNPILQLLDTGNLVVKDGNDGSYIWQSFDHPCDTMISGMKVGLNLKTGQSWTLSSWKSIEDPSIGDHRYEADTAGLPEFKIVDRTKVTEYRRGPWDVSRFGDSHDLDISRVLNALFVSNSTHVFFSFEDPVPVISRLVLTESGSINHYFWHREQKEWHNMVNLVHEQCQTHGKCSFNGICNPSLREVCQCLPGYRPINQNDWDSQKWGEGCERKQQLSCGEAVGFKKLSNTKWPDFPHVLNNNIAMDLRICRDACFSDCSCLAYASTETSACRHWFGKLLDTKQYNMSGQDLYIKVAASEFGSKRKVKQTAIIVSVSVIIGILLLALFGYFVHRKRASKRNPELIKK